MTTTEVRRSDFKGLPVSSMVQCRSRSRNPTWQMSRRELAIVVAEHRGYLTGPGGWIYTPAGQPICHGYNALAKQLGTMLVPGTGINWSLVEMA